LASELTKKHWPFLLTRNRSKKGEIGRGWIQATDAKGGAGSSWKRSYGTQVSGFLYSSGGGTDRGTRDRTDSGTKGPRPGHRQKEYPGTT